MTQKKTNFLFFFFLFLISFIYLFIRLYPLPNLIGFRLDQGIHLLETKTMVDNRQFRLIGPMVTSKSLEGRNFFIGANYYYILGIVGLMAQWDPFTITIIFIILEFLFYLFFIFFLKKKFSSFLSLLTFLFISVSPYLVVHSWFFWNPHLLIPLSILTVFYFDKFVNKKIFSYLFLSAFFWGFAFACHYSAIFWGIFFVISLIKSKNFSRFKSWFLVIIGFILGNLPFFIFEIRNNFYNIKTIFYIFTNSSQADQLTSHYFVFPLLIFIIYFVLFLFQKTSKIFLILFFTLIFFIQLQTSKNYQSLNYISGWDYSTQKSVINIISQDCPSNFNIATTMQGDTRGYDLRYLLNLKKCYPNEVDQYPNSQTIFLISPTSRLPETESVWEISSFRPFKITQKINLNEQLTFYRLDKN